MSPELMMIAALLDVHLRLLSPKKRARFIRELSATFDGWRASHEVVTLRSPRQDAEVRAAQAQAALWCGRVVALIATRYAGGG